MLCQVHPCQVVSRVCPRYCTTALNTVISSFHLLARLALSGKVDPLLRHGLMSTHSQSCSLRVIFRALRKLTTRLIVIAILLTSFLHGCEAGSIRRFVTSLAARVSRRSFVGPVHRECLYVACRTSSLNSGWMKLNSLHDLVSH